MPKKNTRKKRFLVDIKEKIPVYYSEPEEVLTIAYDYKDEETYANKDYLEKIQIAVEEFNNFGFARLVYSPTYNEIPFNPNCPIDEISLRKKYLNKHVFGLLPGLYFSFMSSVCFNSPIKKYVANIRRYLNITPTSLPAFSVIQMDTESSVFQLRGIGVLFHEIFHLFGIKDLITLNINCTNGIYYPNRANENMKNRKYIHLRRLNSFECQTVTYKNFNFTPVSLFSLQQYSRMAIHPFFILNETRITEILTGYQFTAELQKDYFDLLASYQGIAHLITYQDFSALAQAIYLIAPDSMLGRTFNVPYYHLIKGLYRPLADEEKFTRLISAFRKAENFNYPILAQDDLNVTIFNDTTFKIDLAKKLKVVSLTPAPIHCYLEKPKQFKGDLQVSNGCILTGNSQAVGNFTLDLVLNNNVTKLNRFIKLNIKEKNKPLTAILLGRRSVVYTLSENSDVDLTALCHAAALPKREELRCKSFDLPDNLSLANCSILGVNREENYNFTVIFFNAAAEKSCMVQLLSINTSTLVDNLIEQNSGVFIDKSLGLNNEDNTGYYIRYAHSAHETYVLSVNDAVNTVRFIVDNGNYLKQCHYLLTIPLLHGVFEGCIDNIALSPLVKTILKLLPRIGLVSINYLSTLQFPFLFFYSALESFVASHLKAKNNDRFRHVVNLFLFLLVAELEYGFSNLWELADKPQFWPALTDRLNQLFIQMLWAPTVKMAGYLLGVSIMGCCAKSAIPAENNEAKVATNTAEGVLGRQLSFFNSLKLVKDTVFSSKIRRIPRLFYNCFFPLSQREGDDCSNTSEFLQNPVNQVQ
ncbi:MAG: hypothetical protein V4471_06380 [Pseudomonadota bacterium]